MYFLVMLAFSFYYVAFPVFAVGSLGWTIRETGIFFAVMGVLMVVVQGPFYRWVTNWASERLLVVAGSATLAVAFWLFDSVTLSGVYGAVVLLAVGNGIMWPTVLSLLSKAAGSASQGAVQGLAGSLGAVASIAGTRPRRRAVCVRGVACVLGVGCDLGDRWPDTSPAVAETID